MRRLRFCQMWHKRESLAASEEQKEELNNPGSCPSRIIRSLRLGGDGLDSNWANLYADDRSA
jgi:hypothetical protein